jgi:hypothetical protein
MIVSEQTAVPLRLVLSTVLSSVTAAAVEVSARPRLLAVVGEGAPVVVLPRPRRAPDGHPGPDDPSAA